MADLDLGPYWVDRLPRSIRLRDEQFSAVSINVRPVRRSGSKAAMKESARRGGKKLGNAKLPEITFEDE